MSMPEQVQVLIVGGGPAGLALANLLGLEGVDTLLVERNPGCVPEPRAVALDGESLRTLQAAGLVDEVLADLQQGFVADYVNGAGEHLFSMDMTERPYGFCLQNSFDQPTLERQLLAGLDRFPCVAVQHQVCLETLEQDAGGVRASLRDATGERVTVNARYLVGCDGGRSTVRQLLDIPMEGDRLPQRWLVIDTVERRPSGLPECRFFCDPRRPAMTLLRPRGERRWEWMLLEGETDEDLLKDTSIAGLLAEHTDPAQVEVYRKCVYGFSSVVAARFGSDRCFLAGDAAHMTPPFAGQGLNAGMRDVRNLSWKLARVLDGSLPETLLATYDLERRGPAREVVDLALTLGDSIQPTDMAAAAERDAFFRELNRDQAAMREFSEGLVAPLRDVRIREGWFAGQELAGRMLPQPATAQLAPQDLLDHRLGRGFAALLAEGVEIPAQLLAHPLWQALSPQKVAFSAGELAAGGALARFVDGGGSTLTLVRPDRFVLAQVELNAESTTPLDALLDSLGD